MANDNSSNLSRTIVKAMGIFGSIQVFNILCSIVRTKLIALWIGPTGMGLFAIFNSVIEMVGNITNLGVRTSSIRSISLETANSNKLSRVCTALRRWSAILGLVGVAVLVIGAPLFSRLTFGNDSYTHGFIFLAIALLANTLTNGEHAIMQGTAMLRKLAKSSLYGASVGLVLSIPLYYFLGEQSIIPSILCYSLSILFFSYMMRNKDVGMKGETLSFNDTLNIGKDFLKLGFFITLTDIVTQTTNYIFITYLNNVADTATVGYYQAGYTLIAKYTGLILSALCVEYFPRLSKVAHSNMKLNIFVSQELNIALMVLTPVIIAFILFRRLIITILYTESFFVIETFISVGIIGMIFRAVSWCMAYVILAKGKGKLFFITETVDTFIYLALYISAFHLWGMDGFGYAFFSWYFSYTLIVTFIYYRIFHLRLKASCFQWIAWALCTSFSAFLFMQNECYIGAAIVFIIATVASTIKFVQMMRRHK